MRKICVQSGRSSHPPAHVRENSSQETIGPLYVIFPDKDLDHFMEYDYREALLFASGRDVGTAWLMMTRPDIEKHLKTQKSPKALFKAVENSQDAIFTLLISRGATLGSESWPEITKSAIKTGHAPTVRAVFEQRLTVSSDRNFAEEAPVYATSLRNQSLIGTILASGQG